MDWGKEDRAGDRPLVQTPGQADLHPLLGCGDNKQDSEPCAAACVQGSTEPWEVAVEG